jgi:GT2 family glycosyltransferase
VATPHQTATPLDRIGVVSQPSSARKPRAAEIRSDVRLGRLPRVRAEGKALVVQNERFWVRGVTYGTFRPAAEGDDGFPEWSVVARDFARIAATGFNAIRTYTVPPRWVLDAAARRGLRVMVGIPWEQHVTFLDDPGRARSIEARVRAAVRGCAGHPAVLCYTIGNEIPASIVRWYGRRRIERFLRRLYEIAKAEDPETLVTYVNYPTTEYLDLPFLDVVCFNVYLESPDRLEAYLARLHNLAGNRPLVLGEVGLDSRQHGDQQQAETLQWQLRTTFAAGCAGAFVFAWTDEWHRGGHDVVDWDFGLTTRDRRPKPALGAVRDVLFELPFPKDRQWPRISVVVCSHNGARTIRDCFEGLLRLSYPNVEVIVVDDGSTDETSAIARDYPFRLIRTENRGLSSARNTGLDAATGEIVAYIDDDAWPDPHWLLYLADTFLTTTHAGVGGPNLSPPRDSALAQCVANAPGGPVQVLLSDREAEHVPGCNMAFRKAALRAIGGFDPRFRTAGDDVDVCWRLQDGGGTLGFNHAAVVWHHRRASVRAYYRQQAGYGKAEALLEEKWPHKYNAAGHAAWAGRLYGTGLTAMLGRRRRVYHGTWGVALFQSVYEPASGTLAALPLMPEWYVILFVLAGISTLGAMWPPLRMALPLLAVGVGISVGQAALSAVRAPFPQPASPRLSRLGWRSVIMFLHLLQPWARLVGRRRHGLTPWRRRAAWSLAWPWAQERATWCEHWRSASERLQALEGTLRAQGFATVRGGDFDRWDLEARDGALGVARVLVGIEEHGEGRQLVRVKVWPRFSRTWLGAGAVMLALAAGALADGSATIAAVLGVSGALLAGRAALGGISATAAVLRTVPAFERRSPEASTPA